MAIQLGNERTPSTPVLTRARIGETFVGGIIRFDQRNILKDGQPVLKDNGKPRQELVVTLLTRDSDMEAGIGGNYRTPERGEVVRLILKGGGFGQWIEAVDNLGRPLQVGDLVRVTTTHAIRYESMGQHRELGTFNDQAAIEQYRTSNQAWQTRRESLGFRGDLQIRGAGDTDADLVVSCEQQYHALQRQGIRLDDGPGPFDDAPAAQAPPPAPVTAGAGVDDLW